MREPVLVIGEVLWDALPAGLFLGGAPLNVAWHLHALGVETALASAVGDDDLGREAVRRIAGGGLGADAVQTAAGLPTGFVTVALDASGGPSYAIRQPAAWDHIEATADLLTLARRARMVVCGTLAQRAEPSRSTIRALWGAGAPVAVDLNLREPFVDEAVVGASLRAAALAKLNEDELARLRAWYDLPVGLCDACEALARRFDLRTVCVTRGAAGAVLLHEGVYATHPGVPATVVDTVGAGDAFLAALLTSLLAGASPEEALDRAAHRGAQVASQRGAIPAGVG